MTALALKRLLVEQDITQGQLAAGAELSRPTVVGIVNHDRWPAKGADAARHRITQFLISAGIDPAVALRKEKAAQGGNPARPDSRRLSKTNQEAHMIRKQAFAPKTLAHFRLPRSPFHDCAEAADVFLSPDIRYVRECLNDKVKHGGFLAVIGESGAGKSTLREELLERLQRDGQTVQVIQPYVLAMEDNDTKGKTLKAQHIVEAVMATVAPLTQLKSSPEAKFRQVHEALRASSRTGARHLLIIEEAHSLPIPTLKHLKRFLELKDGMRPLITIVLFGQPELAKKLSEQNPEVREVVQRIEIAHLPPLDVELEPFLKHRLQRVGAQLDAIIDQSGIAAIRDRLTTAGNRGSHVYPLAVQNAVTAAMNAAANLGVPKVTADVVKESAR